MKIHSQQLGRVKEIWGWKLRFRDNSGPVGWNWDETFIYKGIKRRAEGRDPSLWKYPYLTRC